MKKQTAVEWLAEKYNYVTWLRNRDEISPKTADEMRKRYLEQAKQIEKINVEDAWEDGAQSEHKAHVTGKADKSSLDYYIQTFKP